MPDRSVAVFLSVTVWLAACSRHPATSGPPPLEVQVVEAVRRDVPIYREWVGTLDGFVNADIKPQVTGYVRHQLYQDGTFVRKGDVLFIIDPRNTWDAAAFARADLQRNEAMLNKARLDVARDRELIAAQAITQQQLDNDLAAEREAEASVAASQANVRQATLTHSFTQVISWIDGVAGLAQVQVGNLVTPATVMTSVSQVDPIKVQFSISESEYLASVRGEHWAEPGRPGAPPLELVLQDGSVHSHRGTVFALNRQFSAQTGTMTVQGSFPNPGNVLRPGQFAKVRAAVETRKDALLVPLKALNELQGNYLVGVVDSEGKFELRPVKTSAQVGAMVLIDQGLNPGDKVVVSFIARLKPGMPVRAKAAEGLQTASAVSPKEGP